MKNTRTHRDVTADATCSKRRALNGYTVSAIENVETMIETPDVPFFLSYV